MSIKRKRSNPSFCPNSTSFDTFTNSPTRLPDFFSQSKPLDPPYSFPWKPTQHPHLQHEEITSQINSRTRKRYRDGRPDEATIHSSTMEKLFSAQKSHPNAEPLPSQSQQISHQVPQQPTSSIRPNQKSTLHSFWQLPDQATRHGMPLQKPQSDSVSTCDDCDNALNTSINQDIMDMDTDTDVACGDCGKRVCDMCAVVRHTRLCLDCAMR